MSTELEVLKSSYRAPKWLTENGYRTLKGGYLLKDETPYDMYMRVAKAAADNLIKEGLYINYTDKFFNLMWKGWLGLATPVAANMGTDRALPISCYSSFMGDSMKSITQTITEVMVMSSLGGGTSVYLGDIRPTGATFGKDKKGKSGGVVPWAKIIDSAIIATNQSSVRRGAVALYMPVDHPDLEDFLRIRLGQGDPNRTCTNVHQAVTITDEFMEKVKNKDSEAVLIWKKLMKTRADTGEPYLIFIDTVNKNNPDCYKANGLTVKASNLCSEVVGFSDADHSFVCCLSSMNLDKYDEWKDTNAAEIATYFLDGVMQEFINKTKDLYGMERAYRFAVKSRMLGLGVLGYHSLLQQKMIPFASDAARQLNEEIFSKINRQTKEATNNLATLLGEPEWCKGFGVRNSHLVSCAPTVSNSMICSEVSPGIEPWDSNYFIKGSAKGDLIQKNQYLKAVIESKNLTQEQENNLWKTILNNRGSIQSIDCFTDLEKEVFKTAREIDQLEIVKQAGARQKYIDQGQSVNLFFDDPTQVDPNIFSKIHFAAYALGLKALYYCRSSAKLKGNTTSNTNSFTFKVSKDFKEDSPSKEFCVANSEATGEPCAVCEG